jgi:hypothetical protein
MPIDANIALGVRPVEPINMLGQMGQMMQLRQAQQEYQDTNAMRDLAAQHGGDISSPGFLNAAGALNPKYAAALRKEVAATEGTQLKTAADRQQALSGGFAWLAQNPSMDNAANIVASWKSQGLIPDRVAQHYMATFSADPSKIAFNADLGAKAAISSKEQMTDKTSRDNAITATGPAYARLNYDIKNPPQHFFTADDGTLMTTSQRGGGGGAAPVPMAGSSAPLPQVMVGGGGAPMGGGSSIMVNPSPINNLAPVNQNALITQPQPAAAPAAPTYAKVRAVPVTKDIVDPTDPSGRRMITVEVNTYKAGTGLGVDGTQAAPAGVLGVANSQIPAGYMPDPTNPQGVVPVPGNAATDPKAAALLRGPRAGYKYNAKGEEVRIPQTGVPEGLRLKPDERWNETKQVVEQVPGSAAFIEQQKKHAGDLNAVKTAQTSTQWGTSRIDKILSPDNKKGFENNFGGFTAYGTKEFSGNTALVKTEIDSLKSDLKNRGLQIIRSGGSIGAITEKEWPIIESMIATLSPKMDVKDARDVLNEVRAKFEALENLAAETYNDQWQNTQYHKPVETRRAAPSSGGGVDATNKFLQ